MEVLMLLRGRGKEEEGEVGVRGRSTNKEHTITCWESCAKDSVALTKRCRSSARVDQMCLQRTASARRALRLVAAARALLLEFDG